MIGLLVHGDNHFIVEGPAPSRAEALQLIREWSVIRIGPAPLSARRIVAKAFREDLEWAVIVPGEGPISDAVQVLLGELAGRGVMVRNAGSGAW